MIAEILVGSIVFAIPYLVFLFVVSFIVWMVVDAAKGDMFWWVVFILGVPIVGAAIYYFVEKKHDYFKLSKEEQQE